MNYRLRIFPDGTRDFFSDVSIHTGDCLTIDINENKISRLEVTAVDHVVDCGKVALTILTTEEKESAVSNG